MSMFSRWMWIIVPLGGINFYANLPVFLPEALVTLLSRWIFSSLLPLITISLYVLDLSYFPTPAV